ncbi:MAG: T9SS type A sorting domain-containing protein [Bacteroidetes bacterium]|nr:T9SS type A sorting domain-containing protein [Bacteroidota bacterium]
MKTLYKYCHLAGMLILMLCASVIVAQQVALTSPANMSQYTLPVSIPFEAAVSGVVYPEPTFLLVKNTLGGFRKLKFGYSRESLYAPLQNVVAGGNTQLEITMKLIVGSVDWTKILIKPMGLGSLSLQPYIAAAGGLGNNWKIIIIPLSDFSPTVNFTQIANIEFPYSANAAPFEIAISCMKFTGGSSPFTWFGEGKTDNKHNGNGGSGELLATLVQSILPPVYPQKVEFYSNSTKLGEDVNPPYQYSWTNAVAGNFSIKARLIMSNAQFYDSPVNNIEILQNSGPAFSVVLTQPHSGDTLLPSATAQLAATVSGLLPFQPDHLLVTNALTGYRKLKLGYSPTSLYSPLLNVIAGGNNMLEITLRDVAGNADWSKIQFRPSGLGTLCVLPYVNAAGGVGKDWNTITIPLSDFVNTINFSSIANLEFPYSASAGNFQLAIKSIRFIGGTNPFVWFGFGKTNNKHNGNGGSGELVANVVLGNTSGDYIEKVEFYSGAVKLGEDTDHPYALSVNGLTQGTYSITAKVISHSNASAVSPAANLVVYQPTVLLSTMSVNISSPVSGSSWLAPLNLPVNMTLAGAVAPGPDYLRVTNTLTGFVKMKLGYSPTSLYTPKQNVILGGNDTLELVIRNCDAPIDWSKIRVRPAGIGLLNLGSYATAVGGIGADWKTIKIPLSAFDPTIDFSALGYFEFPYSANANNFQIGIQRIRFVGGITPFTWFGNGKTNNSHDGNGGAGQMSATIVSPNLLSVDVVSVQLFDNAIMVSQDSQAPFELTLSNPQPGLHNIFVKMVDTRNAIAISNSVTLTVMSEIPQGQLLVTVTFNQPPTTIAVNKAPLRYDKDFAFSFSLDDGLVDAYTCAFKLFGGGYSPATFETYPGLFYTDGCGNNIPFKASLMWNSVNSSFSDIHINTPSYVTWTQLNQMIDSGWTVVNHAYSHATGTGTNYPWQITANDSAVFSHTGTHINHFVAPSGDAGYFPTAWQLGSVCAYSRTTTNGSPYGLKIDAPLNYNQFMIYRDFKSDDITTPETISEALDNCANLSQNGNHYWYNDFTHHVSPNAVGGSLLFPTFQTYMEHAESTYGLSGSDRIWMASGVEVFEYLKLRDACPISWSLFGNQLRILINRDNMPNNLQRYAMSLAIDANANITSVDLNENIGLTFRGATPRKLINLEWQAPAMQSLIPGSGFNSGQSDSFKAKRNSLAIQQIEKSNVVLISLPDYSIKGQISVFDMQGRLVLTINREGTSGSGKFRLELPGLKEGLYLIRYVGADGTIQTGKFSYPQCR